MRSHHQTLCDGTIVWTFDELPISDDVFEAIKCPHCRTIAAEFLATHLGGGLFGSITVPNLPTVGHQN